MIELRPHQVAAVGQMKTGSILKGGVGSGKSITALYYFFEQECNGVFEDRELWYVDEEHARPLYIITTARKRDAFEWERECIRFGLCRDRELSRWDIPLVIDSWNNVSKYCNVCGAFFIFDEQKAIGAGKWAKSFIQIAKKNHWIMLSATPGDSWMDYIPVFVANGFYKNRSEFLREHVVFDRFAKYPKVNRYINEQHLLNLRNQILIDMPFARETVAHEVDLYVDVNNELVGRVAKDRWNIFEDRPIRDAAEYCAVLRKISNSSEERIQETKRLIRENPKLIIFYNFDYELDILRQICSELGVYYAEWNGHKHMDIPKGANWVYLLQYTANAEGWECTETNVMLFYSLTYSWKQLQQCKGRIDRMTTPYSDLYYYYLRGKTDIDRMIGRALDRKEIFNEREYFCKK